jgi:hypothetical protein
VLPILLRFSMVMAMRCGLLDFGFDCVDGYVLYMLEGRSVGWVESYMA